MQLGGLRCITVFKFSQNWSNGFWDIPISHFTNMPCCSTPWRSRHDQNYLTSLHNMYWLLHPSLSPLPLIILFFSFQCCEVLKSLVIHYL